MLERAFYSGLARAAPDGAGLALFVLRHWLPRGVLVDLGTGTGKLLLHLISRQDLLPVGLDHNLTLLASRPPESWGLGADAGVPLPIRDARVDAVVLSSVLHLTSEPERLCSEAVRILKPGGSLFIVTLSDADLSQRYLNRFAPSLPGIDRERYPTLPRLKAALARLGAPVRTTENVRLGAFTLDESFLASLRARPWSSLALLDPDEREGCFTALAERIALRKRNGSPPLTVPLIRTGLVAIRS